MTIPQLRNALYRGEPPEPGVMVFGSQAEAAEWRRARAARIAEAREKRESATRRAEVAALRKARRGY